MAITGIVRETMTDRQADHYQQIVRRAVAATRGDAANMLQISELSRTTGINVRTLRRAFRAIHGVSPSRYFCRARLRLVRDALLSADHGETVTHVAMRFGFRELGRFAALYRREFGESPSATLRWRSEATALSPEPGFDGQTVGEGASELC